MENTTLKLRGMSCASCANNIEEAIRSVPGVEACSVNFAAEQATVTYDPNKADVAALQEAVNAAGYTALPMPDDVLTPEDDVEQHDRPLAALRQSPDSAPASAEWRRDRAVAAAVENGLCD